MLFICGNIYILLEIVKSFCESETVEEENIVWYGFGTCFCPCTGFEIGHQDVESGHTVLNYYYYYYFVIDFVIEIHDTYISVWRQKL
jgi:hypothetical protein